MDTSTLKCEVLCDVFLYQAVTCNINSLIMIITDFDLSKTL